ncbi:MAG: asparaginase [Anaerolineales bacterium]|nr:asparaginase [Anaerolineales bacterium]
MAQSLPLLERTRGQIVESTHSGSIAVVDSNGKLLASYGDPHLVAFLRSSGKPFQALPFVEQGGVEHYDYTPRELALSCASHDGAKIHLEAVKDLQSKVGITEEDLQCGGHLPSDPEMFREFIKLELVPTNNTNNCSGKHTTMLAFAKMRGDSLHDYLDLEHPIQQAILHTLAEMCQFEPEKIQLGVDGCSAPNFALPLYHAALGMARFCDPHELSEARAVACKKITSAMTAYPEMLSNYGEFDCELMKACKGRIVTKRGAEGFQIIGIQPTAATPGVGIAFKVVDGDASPLNASLEPVAKVRPAVTLEILRQLNAISAEQLNSLAKFGPERTLKNYSGKVTGTSRPAFKL